MNLKLALFVLKLVLLKALKPLQDRKDQFKIDTILRNMVHSPEFAKLVGKIQRNSCYLIMTVMMKDLAIVEDVQLIIRGHQEIKDIFM